MHDVLSTVEVSPILIPHGGNSFGIIMSRKAKGKKKKERRGYFELLIYSLVQ
jgi:hypothetical protein